MGCSRYIGRIGALAIVLGVGGAIAQPTGIAWASPTDASSVSDNPANTEGGDTGSPPPPTPKDTKSEGGQGVPDKPDAGDAAPPPEKPTDAQVGQKPSPSASTVEVSPGVTVSSSGGSKKTQKPPSGNRLRSSKKATAPAARATAQTNTVAADAKSVKPAAANSTAPVTEAASVAVAADIATTSLVAAPPAKATPVTAVLNRVVSPILSSILGAIPHTPAESPLAWVFAAAARRQIGVTEPETMEVSTFAATAAVAVDEPPTVDVVYGATVPATGAISGQVVGTDPEGQAVTYALTTPPPTGTLVFDSTTAKFTYTPTTSQRINAAVTPTVPMTVTVSDGTNSVPAVVDIPVNALPIAKVADIGTVNDAHAVAVTATRAYVTNRTAGTVTVIDTTKNTVLGTIAVGPTPDGLTIKPDGTKLYVSSLDNNTVTVVDTKTAAVVKTIVIANPVQWRSIRAAACCTSRAGTRAR